MNNPNFFFIITETLEPALKFEQQCVVSSGEDERIRMKIYKRAHPALALECNDSFDLNSSVRAAMSNFSGSAGSHQLTKKLQKVSSQHHKSNVSGIVFKTHFLYNK